MANTIYINVSGTWKEADDYYVNVGGTWKTGTEFQINVPPGANVSGLNPWRGGDPPTPASLPTYLEAATLDYPMWMCQPYLNTESKSTVDATTLDYAQWYGSGMPIIGTPSSFVYSAPGSPGPSTLPTLSDVQTLDTVGWYGAAPPIIYTESKATVDSGNLDYSFFMCQPYIGNPHS